MAKSMYLANWPLLKRIGEVHGSDITTADSSNTVDTKNTKALKLVSILLFNSFLTLAQDLNII